ncbi:SDR family NAD(P)-dependent oxidoreductase [Mucilaginibacter pedocola]|uniref:NADP-dependent 3-hydroxy acid dehydrogenase YdfG n=1 Tax=Mucilaginibacter pedocola TaxID=1792845 RepID=A0A1S9P770_9SPHI|nr:SDR family oxidoreductase [Mucilaginibacter pedocola]OOQ56795.1 short-chain dehydrogenase [Mucilaginibacter pedocola]
MDSLKTYALVTGATSGIGKELATQLAAKGYNVLLVSRSADKLELLSRDLVEQYGVDAKHLAADLSIASSAQTVADWCAASTSSLSILINNAGYGLWGDFAELELPAQLNMLQLNINAVVELSHRLLPLLKQQKQAYILNVASTAAYQAVPTLALYSASKVFVLSYSRALRYELKDTPVSVSCLCPGPTATGFADRAGMSALAELADKFNMQPDEVAASGLKDMFDKKAEIIPGLLNKLSAAGARHLPKALIEKISAGLYDR